MSVCLASSSAASASCWLKSSWIRRVVRTPTITANPSRITSVRAAEPPASRQRIGRRLYAEDVARAADCMKESWFATGFELSAEVRDEDLDRVGDRERVVARHLVRVGVEGEVGDPQRRHPARRPAPQQRPHAREELLALERLYEVVV